MNLDGVFSAVAYKILAQVDLPGGSHQHEINGSSALKKFFKPNQISRGEITWAYFRDDIEPVTDTGSYLFYDPRAKSFETTKRSEWRMYYSGNFLKDVRVGDILILVRTNDEEIYGLVFQESSSWLRAARTIFPCEEANTHFQFVLQKELSEKNLDFHKKQILSELGIEIEVPIESRIETLAAEIFDQLQKEGKKFPSTKEMAKLAWDNSSVDINDGDLSLIRWLETEETIFRGIEKIEVQARLKKGFESVDDFIQYSLSVHNRRKSRMGFALQNHLGNLLTKRKVKFQAQQYTEGKNQPDFIFPSKKEYSNPEFDSSYLFMLAAKSTCKERWRQILTEANRIKTKHLCTLDQSISVDQTDEMKNKSVVLVIPGQFRNSYSEKQQKDMLSLNEFIQIVKSKQ